MKTKPAVAQVMRMSGKKEAELMLAEKTLLSHLCTGGHTPDLAWYCTLTTSVIFVNQNENGNENNCCQLTYLLTACTRTTTITAMILQTRSE